MSSAAPESLTRAYELIEADKLEDARALLLPLLAQNPNDADAWWLFAHAVSDPKIAREALDNVLRIDPQYPGAAEMSRTLDEHLASLPVTTPPAPAIKPISPVAPATPPPPPGTLPDVVSDNAEQDFLDDLDLDEETEEEAEEKQGGFPLRTIGIGVVVLLLVIWLGIIAASLLNRGTPPATPTGAPTQGIAAVITSTSPAAVAVVTDEALLTQEAQAVLTDDAVVTPAGQGIVTDETVTAEAAAERPTTARATAAGQEETEAALLPDVDETEGVGAGEELSPTPRRSTPVAEDASTPTSRPTATVEPTATSAPTEAPTETDVLLTATMPPTEAATRIAGASVLTPDVTTDQITLSAVYPAFQGYRIVDDGVNITQTGLGSTLLVSVCSGAGAQLRTTLPQVMSIVARQSAVIAGVDAYGVRMVNCAAGNTPLLVIAVNATDAAAYASGSLSEQDFRRAWQPQ